MSIGGQNSADLRGFLEPDEVDMSVVITDPSKPNNPMVFISDEFEQQTGYTPASLLGQNCRVLQGPETNPKAIEAIQCGLKARTRLTIDILNYRKDGTKFVNRLRIRPLFDEAGKLCYFVGVQNPIS